MLPKRLLARTTRRFSPVPAISAGTPSMPSRRINPRAASIRMR